MAKRQVTPLSDTAIKNAKPKEKEYTLPDGNGLQLLIKTDGRKVWEIRYTIEGKAKKTTAGTYPETSLAKARSKRDELKAKVSDGIDPIKAKQALKRNMKKRNKRLRHYQRDSFIRWFTGGYLPSQMMKQRPQSVKERLSVTYSPIFVNTIKTALSSPQSISERSHTGNY
jgi:hypothetical protein